MNVYIKRSSSDRRIMIPKRSIEKKEWRAMQQINLWVNLNEYDSRNDNKNNPFGVKIDIEFKI